MYVAPLESCLNYSIIIMTCNLYRGDIYALRWGPYDLDSIDLYVSTHEDSVDYQSRRIANQTNRQLDE